MSLFNFIKNQLISSSNHKEVNEQPKIKEVSNKKKLLYFNEEYEKLKISTPINLEEASKLFLNKVCCNCGCILEKEIKGTAKCPDCKEKVYVRTDMISKKKLLIGEQDIEKFNKYDKLVREILFMEKLMKNNEYIYRNYMELFYSLKQRSSSFKDTMWQFSNKVGYEMDNMGYKQFMKASKLESTDRVLENDNAIRNLELATLQYVTLYEIASYEKKNEIAFNMLTDIAYRDIQIVVLDKEGNPFYEFEMEDYINKVHSALTMEFLEKNNYTIDEFKNKFLENKHPFILPRLSNEETWKYIEKALKKQQTWNKNYCKNKESESI